MELMNAGDVKKDTRNDLRWDYMLRFIPFQEFLLEFL